MVDRLPSKIFLFIALLAMAWGMAPIVRVVLGLDQKITGSFMWSVSLLIAGLMCGLTAMLIMVRKQPIITNYRTLETDSQSAAIIHASGLLIFTGIPLANFLICYILWIRKRRESRYLDNQGREAICFQITVYLYLLMCLFMAYIIVGALAIPLLLLFHLLATLTAILLTLNGKTFRYPANITIIDRGLQNDCVESDSQHQ